MRPTGVHHVSLMTPAVDETIAFYVDVLGLTVRTDRPDFGVGGAWLDAGDQQVHLIEGPTPNYAGQHFALRVDDLDGVIAELRAQGFDVADPFETTVSRQTTIRDPAGNVVELNQPR
jgi:catechol 2,3-dioxygenase-like lactoylglutathione lyase family enzyme